MHLRLPNITSFIAGIGLAVSAIAQPAVPTKEMVVTPFEQVKIVPIDPTWQFRHLMCIDSLACSRLGPNRYRYIT